MAETDENKPQSVSEAVEVPGAADQAPQETGFTKASAWASGAGEQPQVVATTNTAVTWTASEFIDHHKSPGWYMLLLFITIGLATVIYFLTKDWISVGVAVLVGAVFGSYAGVKPRQLEYKLTGQGIDIGPKHYAYSEFRAFSVVPEGAFSSIILMPLKRFAPLTTIYYAPDDEKKIVDVLSGQLPFEQHRHDAIDRFLRRIRF